MAIPPAGKEPTLLNLSKPVLPWWRDNGLRKLILWQSFILLAQMTVGYDESIIGSFQSIQAWQDSPSPELHPSP